MRTGLRNCFVVPWSSEVANRGVLSQLRLLRYLGHRLSYATGANTTSDVEHTTWRIIVSLSL
jgi:hypothetical protein